jgi:multidrug efflux pump subunit AcrA (membrane-fusion protein)
VPPRAVALVAVVAAALAGCNRTAATPAPRAESPARDVEVALVVDVAWPRTLRLPGDLRADEESTLATKVEGRVAQVRVDLGSRVAHGDVVVELEAHDLELRVAQSEAALEAARARLGLDTAGEDDAIAVDAVPMVRSAQSELDDARRDHERQASLSGDGIASRSVLDRAIARVEAAESALAEARDEVANRRALIRQRRAELALAQQLLRDATIRAPFDGVVAQRLVDRGEFIDPGDPVARLVRLDPVRLHLDVPAVAAARTALGQALRFAPTAGAPLIDATITRIAPELDARNRTLAVEADLPNADGALRPGAFVDVELMIDPDARALAVPLAALSRFAGVDRVVVAKEGRAVEKLVTVGRIDGERVELLQGVAAGEAVVLAPGALRHGDALRVAK